MEQLTKKSEWFLKSRSGMSSDVDAKHSGHKSVEFECYNKHH